MTDAKNTTNLRGMLSPERPIEKTGQDVLDRSLFVERLCHALIDEETNRSTGVIVGLTGPWGSGKSSILNLLHAALEDSRNYPKVVVVRFDPWIVSGQNAIIAQFFSELAGSIRNTSTIGESAKLLATTLTEYGAHLAPFGNLLLPAAGSGVGGILKALQRLLTKEKSLQQQRSDIRKLLDDIEIPIVVLIDEVDRVENDEIRSIAQLVRAVLDFPGISYVLAYDPKRVIQALGDGDDERGRSYLEKIVQLQIPLPIAFDDELSRTLNADLVKLAANGIIPDDWSEQKRYEELRQIIIPALLSTPRDVARLAGSFIVLERMLRGEVDWIDLLGYCCLIVRAQETDERIRRDPDLVCDIPMSASALQYRFDLDDAKKEELISYLIGNSERKEPLSELLGFLFPCLKKGSISTNADPDAIYHRDRLLTVMRLNLLPGLYSRQKIESILREPQGAIEKFLWEALAQKRLGQLIDRLSDIFPNIEGVDHFSVWLAFSDVLRQESPHWETQLSPFHGLPLSVARLFERLVSRGAYNESQARKWFHSFVDCGDVALTSLFIRTHIFGFGLYGHELENRANRVTFLDRAEVEHLAESLSQRYRTEHLEGDWLAAQISLNPVYTMLDCGAWDNACKEKLNAILKKDDALIGFTLMSFGGNYSTERETLRSMIDYETYRRRVAEILNGPSRDELHHTALAALNKVLDASF